MKCAMYWSGPFLSKQFSTDVYSASKTSNCALAVLPESVRSHCRGLHLLERDSGLEVIERDVLDSRRH
jgi:hypothetical protein